MGTLRKGIQYLLISSKKLFGDYQKTKILQPPKELLTENFVRIWLFSLNSLMACDCLECLQCSIWNSSVSENNTIVMGYSVLDIIISTFSDKEIVHAQTEFFLTTTKKGKAFDWIQVLHTRHADLPMNTNKETYLTKERYFLGLKSTLLPELLKIISRSGNNNLVKATDAKL